MRRLPVVPTLVVALAVAAMIALGIWQLQRARVEGGAARRNMRPPRRCRRSTSIRCSTARSRLPPLSFRRALVTCQAAMPRPTSAPGAAPPTCRARPITSPAGRARAGLAGRLRVNAGWAPRPDAARRLSLDGLVAGRLGAVGEDGPVTLTAATAAPPLAPSQPPSLDSIPNNHRLYALQWFFFAAAALVIYAAGAAAAAAANVAAGALSA